MKFYNSMEHRTPSMPEYWPAWVGLLHKSVLCLSMVMSEKCILLSKVLTRKLQLGPKNFKALNCI